MPASALPASSEAPKAAPPCFMKSRRVVMGSAGRRDKAGFASRLAVQECTVPVGGAFRKVVVTEGGVRGTEGDLG